MPKLLVIQWARLGDLLQTRVLLDRLRRIRPNAEIALSFDRKYEEVVASFPEVDRALPIDLKSIVDMLRLETGWPDGLDMLMHETNLASADEIYNLTNHASACRFAELISCDTVRGYSLRAGRIAAPTILAEENIKSLVQKAPCHVADLWANLAESDEPAAIPVSLCDTDLSKRNAIALIADAGSASRSLTSTALHRWTKVLEGASGRCTIYWTGAQRPTVPCESEHAIDLRGGTSLRKLMQLFASCKLVVGPDTGALHLAAAMGCETVGIFVGGSAPSRTGPYHLASRCFKSETLDEFTEGEIERQLCGANIRGADSRAVETYYPLITSLGIEYVCESHPVAARDETPELSIIITEFGQTHYTDTLLQQLRASSDLPSHEIIVSSSGLRKIDSQHAQSRSGVRSQYSDTARSFACACNMAVRSAKGKYLLFLNDDIELHAVSLSRLWAVREKRRIVAPVLKFWDGVRQSAGISIRGGLAEEIGLGTSTPVATEPDGVSAAVMLMARDLFNEIGGFDETFVNGFEDVDFCLRAAQEGVSFHVKSDIEVVHYRGSSPQRFDCDAKNEELLRRKWEFPVSKVEKSTEVTPAEILFLSSAEENEAGPQSRWIDPMLSLNVPCRRIGWIFTGSDLETRSLSRALMKCEMVIVFRGLQNETVSKLLSEWKRETGKPLLLDTDDLILQRFPLNSARAERRSAVEGEFRVLQSLADYCSAASEELLDLHGVPAKKRLLIPSLPMRAHFEKRVEHQPQQLIRIGFAASPSHQTDFAQCAQAIEELLEERRDVVLYWWGCYPGALAHHPAVRHGGAWISDYSAHLQRLKQVPIDFWLVPLSESTHNSVRTPIRMYELCGMGAPVIASNVAPYADWPNSSALLLKTENTTGAWLESLREMIRRVRNFSFGIAGDPVTRDLLRARQRIDLYRSVLALAQHALTDLPVSIENDHVFSRRSHAGTV